MAHLAFTGAIRARKLQEVRGLLEFRIRPGSKLELYEVVSDPETRLAWMECYNGTFRLPSRMFDWAESVEAQAQRIVQHNDIFPCWSLWDEDAETGEIQVEIFPRGYRSPFNR